MVELNVSFKKPQWNLYKVDTIGAWQKCPLYGVAHFIESPSKNQKSSRVNMKAILCYHFPSPDLLEGPKDGKINENAEVFLFYSKVFKQGLVHLTTDREVHLIYNQWISSHFCWKCPRKPWTVQRKERKLYKVKAFRKICLHYDQ